MAKTAPDLITQQQLGLQGFDHLEFWVGNARAFTGFMAAAFGFEIVAYAGPETGRRESCSYVLSQGEVTFVVTGALTPESDVAAHVLEHGDGVRDVALKVADCRKAFDTALSRGAHGFHAPMAGRSAIKAYGDTLHSFIETDPFADFGSPKIKAPEGGPVGLQIIDHVVCNVPLGTLEQWVGFYETVMGFGQMVHFDDDQISTEYSALMSTVVNDGAGKIVLPINEPANGKRKSQIEEYLEFYRGPGVQHIAMRTDDIVSAVRELRRRGVRFLRVPKTYYEEAPTRTGLKDLPWEQLAELGILVDRDHDGYLLQIFTENVTDRPTVFFEIIQREGSRGFGAGNFKALFEAIEREQEQRGNL